MFHGAGMYQGADVYHDPGVYHGAGVYADVRYNFVPYSHFTDISMSPPIV